LNSKGIHVLKHTRFGYSLEKHVRRIFKRKDFARWMTGEQLGDDSLCKAIREMEDGLIDSDLGGLLYKKRVARPGQGKRGGYRTLLAAKLGQRYVFLLGFAKGNMDNITPTEKKGISVHRQSDAGTFVGWFIQGIDCGCFTRGAL
jgi:hypothetical protein